MEVLARCKVDIEGVLSEVPNLIEEENSSGGRYIWKQLYERYQTMDTAMSKFYDSVYNRTYPRGGGWFQTSEEMYTHMKLNFRNNFQIWENEASLEGSSIKLYFRDCGYSIVGLSTDPSTCWLLPDKFVTVLEYKDYSHLSRSQRRSLLSGGLEAPTASELAEVDSLTLADAESRTTEASDKLKDLQSQMDAVKKYEVEELRKLKAEIDAKQAELAEKKHALMQELEQRKAEMEDQLERLQFDVFKLDSEIYAIRCYTGEVVETIRIRKGLPAPESEAIVIHQKMRYLDEELGKLASIYDADFSDAGKFETLLAHRDDVLEYFAPTPRSVMLVRVSRSASGYYHSNECNMLERYEKWHGKKVAIIIRDGENVYLTWTDDDRINFADDAFYRPGVSEMADSDASELNKKSYESDRDYEKRIREMRMGEIRDQLGRYYVFSILQGLVDRDFIKFPEKVQIADSPYVFWSYADAWIASNKYGEFSDMITRCNESVRVGDAILTTSHIRPEIRKGYHGSYADQAYHNDRGRGEKNRTHDVSAKDNTIYRINLVEHSATYTFDAVYHDDPDKKEHTVRVWTDEEYRAFLSRDWGRYRWMYQNLEQEEGSDKYQFFISLKKEANWETGVSASANFELYKSEFINLTFMNSVWLTYVLNNHKAHDIIILGRSVDYAYVLPYIKTAIQHCKSREEQFAEWIREVSEDPDKILSQETWPVQLSEWMLENDYHNFSKFRAKQFIKHCNSLYTM